MKYTQKLNAKTQIDRNSKKKYEIKNNTSYLLSYAS